MFWLIPISLGLGAAALAPLWLSALESTHKTSDPRRRYGESLSHQPYPVNMESMKRYQL